MISCQTGTFVPPHLLPISFINTPPFSPTHSRLFCLSLIRTKLGENALEESIRAFYDCRERTISPMQSTSTLPSVFDMLLIQAASSTPVAAILKPVTLKWGAKGASESFMMIKDGFCKYWPIYELPVCLAKGSTDA